MLSSAQILLWKKNPLLKEKELHATLKRDLQKNVDDLARREKNYWSFGPHYGFTEDFRWLQKKTEEMIWKIRIKLEELEARGVGEASKLNKEFEQKKKKIQDAIQALEEWEVDMGRREPEVKLKGGSYREAPTAVEKPRLTKPDDKFFELKEKAQRLIDEQERIYGKMVKEVFSMRAPRDDSEKAFEKIQARIKVMKLYVREKTARLKTAIDDAVADLRKFEWEKLGMKEK